MESCCKIMLKEKLGMLFFILVGMSYPVLAEVLVSTTEHLLYARHFRDMSPSLWCQISRLSTQMPTRTVCAALSQWPLSVLAPPQGQEHSMPGAWTFPSWGATLARIEKPTEGSHSFNTHRGAGGHQTWIFHQGASGFERKANTLLSLKNDNVWGISKPQCFWSTVNHYCSQWDLLAPKAPGLSQFGEGSKIVSLLWAREQAPSLLDLKFPEKVNLHNLMICFGSLVKQFFSN